MKAGTAALPEPKVRRAEAGYGTGRGFGLMGLSGWLGRGGMRRGFGWDGAGLREKWGGAVARRCRRKEMRWLGDRGWSPAGPGAGSGRNFRGDLSQLLLRRAGPSPLAARSAGSAEFQGSWSCRRREGLQVGPFFWYHFSSFSWLIPKSGKFRAERQSDPSTVPQHVQGCEGARSSRDPQRFVVRLYGRIFPE